MILIILTLMAILGDSRVQFAFGGLSPPEPPVRYPCLVVRLVAYRLHGEQKMNGSSHANQLTRITETHYEASSLSVYIIYSKYVSPPCCRVEMYAGRRVLLPGESR